MAQMPTPAKPATLAAKMEMNPSTSHALLAATRTGERLGSECRDSGAAAWRGL
jgi:hypothetical protein